MEKRRFKRLPSNLVTRIRMQQASEQARRAILTRIRDISVGGVFIETHSPFPVGTLVEFDFELPGIPQKVHVNGIVRWSCEDQREGRGIGMGIEFLKVAVQATQAIREYVGTEDAKEMLVRVTRTQLHQSLLKIARQRAGQSLLLEALRGYTGCDVAPLREALQDFAEVGLVHFTHGSEVQFLEPPEGPFRRLVEAWGGA